MTKDEIILAGREFLFPAVFHYYQEPLVIARAKEQFVYDADGNQYLDFFGGILTISVGHCNERVNAKVHEQIDRLEHVSYRVRDRAAGRACTAHCRPDARWTPAQIVFHHFRRNWKWSRRARNRPPLTWRPLARWAGRCRGHDLST